jgi:hypothetical protein
MTYGQHSGVSCKEQQGKKTKATINHGDFFFKDELLYKMMRMALSVLAASASKEKGRKGIKNITTTISKTRSRMSHLMTSFLSYRFIT